MIFDFDGTLIDTESVELASLRALWRAHDRAFDESRWTDHMGLEAPDWVSILADEAAANVKSVELRAALQTDQRERTARQPLRPGIGELIDFAAHRGIPLGIASNADRERVDQALGDKELHNVFGTVVTRDDVDRGKPAPDVYKKACNLLGVGPSDCIAIEDSEPGMASAIAAGLRCIAVPTSFTADHDFSAAHLVVPEADQISLPDLAVGRLRPTGRRPSGQGA